MRRTTDIAIALGAYALAALFAFGSGVAIELPAAGGGCEQGCTVAALPPAATGRGSK